MAAIASTIKNFLTEVIDSIPEPQGYVSIDGYTYCIMGFLIFGIRALGDDESGENSNPG